MFSRRGFLVFLVVLSTLGFEGSALAATANFQGNCTNSNPFVVPTDCQFSPNKAPAGQPFTGCNGAGVSSYSWDFGDGSTAVTTPAVNFGNAYHTYPAGSFQVNVHLTVTCGNGATATARNCVLTTFLVGCVVVNAGWTP